MPSRKQRAVTGVPDERWAQFGKALQAWREDVLGYKFRTVFARERLPLTEEGNPNTKIVQELENNYRPGTYTKWSLEDAEKAYGITHESVLAFLHGETDTLAPADPPAAPAVLPVPGEPPGWMAADEERSAANRPYADRIRGRLDLLRLQGVTAPSGAQLFGEGTEDARIWDKYAADWEARDVVWFVADMQRRADHRGGGPAVNSHGALCRGNIAGPRLMRHLPGSAVMDTVYTLRNGCAPVNASRMTVPAVNPAS